MPGKAQSHRLRAGRHSEAGRIYHIRMTCHNRHSHFNTLWKGRCVVRAFQASSDLAETVCYTVMPDHVHWVLRLKSDATLSAAVRKAKGITTLNWRALTACDGMLWQSGFYDRALRNDDDLVTLCRYVVANPLRAGLVRSVRDYSLWDAVWI
ncbi:REP-associated tyrosine transposase [Alloalcanivorax xenomutans]|nr:transposase [Alloalcanivorax xenomutans]